MPLPILRQRQSPLGSLLHTDLKQSKIPALYLDLQIGHGSRYRTILPFMNESFRNEVHCSYMPVRKGERELPVAQGDMVSSKLWRIRGLQDTQKINEMVVWQGFRKQIWSWDAGKIWYLDQIQFPSQFAAPKLSSVVVHPVLLHFIWWEPKQYLKRTKSLITRSTS